MDYAVELHKEEEKLSLELRQAQAKWEKKQKKQRKIMEESHVAEVVSRQTKIPVSRLEKDETRRLQKLEKSCMREWLDRMKRWKQYPVPFAEVVSV